MKKTVFKGYIYVVLSAVIYGLMPLMAKFIYAEGVTPLSLVFLRNVFSSVIILVFSGVTGVKLRVSPKLIPKICGIGLMGSCVTALLLYCSYNHIPSGAATVLHFIYPAVVVAGEFVFLKKRLNPGQIISVVMCVLGIAMFYNPDTGLNLYGSVLAVVSGITYSIYIISLSAFGHKEIPAFIFNFYTCLATSVIMLPVCIITDNLSLPTTASGWALAVLFGLALGFGATVLFQKGTFIIGGSRASVLSAFEPITSVIAGIVIFSEPFSLVTLAGTLLVITAGILIAVSDRT